MIVRFIDHDMISVEDIQWRKLCEILGEGGGSAEGTRFLGGYGGMLPQNIFKIWIPEMTLIAAF
jgi:hypothetical protein